MGRGQYYRLYSRATKRTVESGITLATTDIKRGINAVASGEAVAWSGVSTWSNIATGKQTASISYEIRRLGATLYLKPSYKTGDTPYTYEIFLTETTPNYGGRRWWFICPLLHDGTPCRRRVGKVYLPSGAVYFGCRHCHNLTYQSTRDDLTDKVDSRLYKVRRQMRAKGEVTGGILDPIPPRRHYIHLKTYGRLMMEYYNLLELRDLAFYAGMIRILGVLPNRFTPDDMPSKEEGTHLERMAKEEYRTHRSDRYRMPMRLYRMASLLSDEEGMEPPAGLTLGEIAKQAGVAYGFALEAQREGLIRADSGRGTRKRSYRPKLSSWLEKLHVLRSSGFTWNDLKAWARRRWKPGHEDERQHPR